MEIPCINLTRKNWMHEQSTWTGDALLGRPLRPVLSVDKCILFWQSSHDIKKRVTASRGRKAYVSAIWKLMNNRYVYERLDF